MEENVQDELLEEECVGGGFLKGLFIGGVVGALAGILFAPKAGKELRSDLMEKGGEAYDGAKQFYSEAREKAKNIMEDAQHRADELKKEAKRQLDEARLKAKEVLRGAQEKASKAAETGTSGMEPPRQEYTGTR